MCLQPSASVCAIARRANPLRSGRNAQGPPSWEEAILRPQRGVGADATSHQAQLYENRLSFILFWPKSSKASRGDTWRMEGELETPCRTNRLPNDRGFGSGVLDGCR